MESIHPWGWEDGFEDPFEATVTFSAEVDETPAGVAPTAFRWYEEDSGDDLADEILAWASAEEPAASRMDEPSDVGVPPASVIRAS
jgi:hypothetical protein